MTMFDPNVDPAIPGGLTKEHKDFLAKAGFVEKTATATTQIETIAPTLPAWI
jgi:hypothetical protein